MNILYHHRTQGHGAEGVHITGIVRGFEARGHRVALLSPPGVDPLKTAGAYLYGRKASPLGRLWKSVSRHSPQIFFELLELGYNLFHGRRLARLLAAEKVDFIYERYAFFLWATAALARRRGIPLILEVNEISGLKRARPLALASLARSIERRVFSVAARVVTVSSFLKERIVELGIPAEKVVVMPNGVDPDLFRPRDGAPVRKRLGLDGCTVAGFVGWIDPWDNLPGLLEVFRELAGGRPDLRLLLVGDVAGKGVDPDLVAKMVERNGLTGRVTHLRRVPRQEMPDHMAAMDLCVIPDSNVFGSPVVLFEFMGMGKPVAAPSVPPVLDVLRDGENGLVFEAHNGASLGAALRRLIEDEGLRRRLGAAARAEVENRRSWAKNAEAVLDLHEAVRRNGGGRP